MSNSGGIRLYVGNLPYAYRDEELYKMFAQIGRVTDAVVMMEPDQKDRSRGFGFVTMESQEEAEKAATEVNGKDILGRALVCNIAKPRAPRFNF